MVKNSLKSILIPLILVAIMAVLVWSIGYQTPRTNFSFFIAQYLLLFVSFYIFWLNKANLKFSHFFITAIFLRLILIFAAPELSNDFYRFIWDGELISQGINPFSSTPDQIFHDPFLYNNEYMRTLYHGMGELSQQHYTCYPVLNQVLFFIPTYFFDNIMYNTIGLKLIVILADLGAIFFAIKIAEHLGVSVHNIWLYALNPFIILEFAGNLHFEGVMIFFLLGSLYFLMKNNWLWSAVWFGLAVQIKLIPLMLIPFVFKKLKWKNALGFTALTAFVVLAIGGAMLNPAFFDNMMQSVNEYFIRFQFNAGFFYILREIGFATVGWDPILVVGPVLSVISTLGILTLALIRAYRNDLDIIKGMLFAFMIYYGLATTVHPWYISLILVLSVFTQYKFGLVWSIVVMLSYSAYGHPGGFGENPVLLIAEYSLVYVVLFFEIRRYWTKEAVGLQLKDFFKG